MRLFPLMSDYDYLVQSDRKTKYVTNKHLFLFLNRNDLVMFFLYMSYLKLKTWTVLVVFFLQTYGPKYINNIMTTKPCTVSKVHLFSLVEHHCKYLANKSTKSLQQYTTVCQNRLYLTEGKKVGQCYSPSIVGKSHQSNYCTTTANGRAPLSPPRDCKFLYR